MKQTITTGQYTRRIAHNHNSTTGLNNNAHYLGTGGLQNDAVECDSRLSVVRDEVTSQGHTYHYRMELARKIWKNYRGVK